MQESNLDFGQQLPHRAERDFFFDAQGCEN